MIILGNYKKNYAIATKTAQWAMTPKSLSLVLEPSRAALYMSRKKGTPPFLLHTEPPLRDSWLLRNGQNFSVHQISKIWFIEVSFHVFLPF